MGGVLVPLRGKLLFVTPASGTRALHPTSHATILATYSIIVTPGEYLLSDAESYVKVAEALLDGCGTRVPK